MERIYTVNLSDAYNTVRNKRTPRAVKLLRSFAQRHMKARDMRVVLSPALNNHLWKRSIQKPPRRVKVRIIKREDALYVYLADEKLEAKGAEGKKEERGTEEKGKVAKKEEAVEKESKGEESGGEERAKENEGAKDMKGAGEGKKAVQEEKKGEKKA